MPAGTACDDVFASLAALPGVANAVDEAREAVDALRGHRLARRAAERVAAESMLHGARASAALEGADLSLDVVRRTVRAGGAIPAAERRVVEGTLRVAAELGRLSPVWRSAPLQALARLHALAAAGLVPADQLGRPRADAAVRLSALAGLLGADTDAPALVVAAVVHGEVLGLQAFPGANGVVARAASRLVLVTRGLDPNALSVPEAGHVELGRHTYTSAAAGYHQGGEVGVAGWIRHCARAVVLGAREGVAVCQAMQRGA